MDSIPHAQAAGPLDPDPLVRDILARHAGEPGALLPILHDIQDALGYIPDAIVPQVATGIQRSRAEVHGVIQFYSHFRSVPPARLRVEVCRAESCQACGGRALYEHARSLVSPDRSGDLAVEPVYCLGLCAQSPAVMINGQPHARVTPEKLDALLATLPEA